ncbi:protein transport protein Sec31A isoform X2 [Danaus plexippus]|uniref:protein transport protein Sec31A isoform X2 n=1 Tax=Danaus plexippus TaxID=13037 RepID=UPI002AB254D2|nr:protein transport protein Sec31A isoform X2 [Danaus plexippus]
MKIKELKRTVNMSWSPAELYPSMLVTGSAAQQVDASFSSNASLELYSLNLGDPTYDLELKSSMQTEHKFQKLVWSGAGVIVGGCDGGLLEFYNAEKLLKNSSEAFVGSSTKHTGQVSALDINPYQKNLLASGASDSEIFIWDLNNTSQPMAPGARSAPHDHVQGVAWNQQVQHILGSTFATRCLVWDLRKNEPIMKLSDSQSGSRWRALAWHPQVATQLCVASDHDHAPVLQLWDLRLAASPLVTMEGHEKGVLSLSWSKHDEDLLLSAGKDGSVRVWNPANTKPGGEMVLEVCRQSGWVLDVSWSPRTPGLLAAASFDQTLSLHTMHHVAQPAAISAQGQSDIMDSFGGAESFLSLPVVSPSAPPPAPAPQAHRPPRWLKRPVRARFAFGGKLVSFERCRREAGAQETVYISQVVSEPEIVEKAMELDKVIGLTLSQEPDATHRLAEYCREKGDAAVEQSERYEWFFLRANFLPSYRTELLNLLGFKQDEISSRFKGLAVNNEGRAADAQGLSRTGSTETEAELSTDTSTDLSDAQTLIERKLSSVELEPSVRDVVIPNGDDLTSEICRSLVMGQLEEAVELCLEDERVADALVIASLGSQELLYKVQRYHLYRTCNSPVSLVAGGLLGGRWAALVAGASPSSWRDVLAALLTHCHGESLQHYCEMLGDKLSSSSEASLREAAVLCYTCCACGEPLCRRALRSSRSPADLAAAAERALLLRRAAAVNGSAAGGSAVPGGSSAVDVLLEEYAARLAAQGCLRSALAALQGANTTLNDRLEVALRMKNQYHNRQQPSGSQQTGPRSRTVSGHTHTQPRGQYTHTYTHNDSHAYNQHPAEPPSWSAPPRPLSATPQPGGISGRSKYKVDPSVQAAPLYNQYSFNNPAPPQPSYGYNSPLPEQYGSAAPVNNFAPINRPNPVPLNPAPLNPAPLNPAPLNPAPLSQPQPEPMSMSQYAPPRPAAPGWNDPPMVTNTHKFDVGDMSASHAGTRHWTQLLQSRRSDEPKQEVQQQAPITHPLFGVEPPQHVPLVPAPGQNHYQPQNQFPPAQYPGQFQGQYQGQPAHFPGQQDQFSGQQPPDQYQPQYPGGYQQNYVQQAAAPPASGPPAPPAPVPKPPLSADLAPIQTAFDELHRVCLERAHNTQIKRKLEDVQRRLETLYDILRENKLSPSALSALHTSAALAGRGEASSALQACSELAAGSDFAAAASFLPGLKMLFLLADQLR